MIPFTNIKEYEEYLKDIHPTKVYTIEERDKLSPDIIDNAQFWAESYEKFGPYIYSPINQHYASVDEWMRNSTLLANQINALSAFNAASIVSYQPLSVLEVGPGLGNLWIYLQRFLMGQFNYHCYDIMYPKECVIPHAFRLAALDESSLIKYDIIYCVNVFQHFSAKQQNYYLDLFSKLLNPTGRLILSRFGGRGSVNCEDGKSYCFHLGQLTESQKPDSFYSQLDNKFRCICELTRFDGTESYILVKI